MLIIIIICLLSTKQYFAAPEESSKPSRLLESPLDATAAERKLNYKRRLHQKSATAPDVFVIGMQYYKQALSR